MVSIQRFQNGIAAADTCLKHHGESMRRLKEYKRYQQTSVDLTEEVAKIEKAERHYRQISFAKHNPQYGRIPGRANRQLDSSLCDVMYSLVDSDDSSDNRYDSENDIPNEYKDKVKYRGREPYKGEEKYPRRGYSVKEEAMSVQMGVRFLTKKQQVRVNVFGLRNALDHHRQSSFFRKERLEAREKRRASKRYKRQKDLKRKREERLRLELETRASEYDCLSESQDDL